MRRHLTLIPGGLIPPAPVATEQLDASPGALARRLGVARSAAGLTQSQAARLVKASVAWLGQVERGRVRLALDEVHEFAVFYGCSDDWLLGLVPEVVDRSYLPPTMRQPLSPEDERQLLLVIAMSQTINKTAPAATGAVRKNDA